MIIDETWSCEREGFCWALHERIVTEKVDPKTRRKTGEAGERINTTWHGTLGQAILHVAERKMMDCPTLEAALVELKQFETRIRELCGNSGPPCPAYARNGRVEK